MFGHKAIRRLASSSLRSRPLHLSSARRALSTEQTQIVKSTAPVLADHGKAITAHFYKRLLERHPQLKNIFNISHQESGVQSSALANAVWAYAANIDNLPALSSAVSRIGHKHASLGVTPDQYPIVGEHLLASIKEVLGDGANQTVLDAWRAAYQQLADIFINFEKGLYNKAAITPEGWNSWREFVVARKVRESDEIISFHLKPRDKSRLPGFIPGQFVSVRCYVPELGLYQPRQYSLSDTPNGEYFQISVKRESAAGSKPAGRMSNVLHESILEGAQIEASMPYGDFTVDLDARTPVVLVSGGVGLTPMMAMLKMIVERGDSRRVVFVHAVRNRQVHAMNQQLLDIMTKNPQITRAIFYEQVDDGAVKGVDYDFVGRVNLSDIKDMVYLPDADYYLCGPRPFMEAQRQDLESSGVNPERIHSEVFGVEG